MGVGGLVEKIEQARREGRGEERGGEGMEEREREREVSVRLQAVTVYKDILTAWKASDMVFPAMCFCRMVVGSSPKVKISQRVAP